MIYEEEVAGYREEINRLNQEILDKIVERVGVAKAISQVKRRHGRPVVDAARERVVLEGARAQAAARGLNSDGVERIFRGIIDLCVDAEEKP